ncbi:hypothetical protein RQP46_003040 [Phenoliferia psychrophenolica]
MLFSQILISIGLLQLASAAAIAPLSKRAIPTPVSAATARYYLKDMTVTPQGNEPPYDRDLFTHWITRDGQNVRVDSECRATSGTWYDEYTGNTYPLASDVDIDHMVPLSNAWRSGARYWTSDQRRDFANDLQRPQLIAVDDSTNQRKGDSGPEDFMPPRAAFHCTYIRAWVQVKHDYQLTVTQAEYNKIDSVLVNC